MDKVTLDSKFWSYWRDLFLAPKKFFKKNFKGDELPNFWPAALVFALASGIDNLDRQMLRFELRGDFEYIEFLNNWPAFWAMSIVAGLLGGFISYMLAGWFYKVRLKWSGATTSIKKARNLYLFASLIVSVVIVLITIIDTFVEPTPVVVGPVLGDPGLVSVIWPFVAVVLIVVSSYYSVYVSYAGVVTATDAKKSKARWWFAILPTVFYTFVWATAITYVVSTLLG